MQDFIEIDPKQISDNFIKAIGSDWALVTAGDHVEQNTMTVSWGGVGVMWNYPVAIVVIRPQRYTFEFTERCDKLTLSFLPEQYRKALTYCGTHSGRDEDKISNAGLSVTFTEEDTPAIAEARLVLECRKLYTDNIKAENFIEQGIVERWYPESDFHKVYVLQITNAYIKK
ncbi:MAG: flavin reductase family protein [Alistipes sp.]|nr:flavin reductase family protein [Alistipes sp.]MBR2331432.1 flavin reductase family protein [Alistipes sp.]MBR6662335.1 flavin reductase family protein [Alistipes sp.]